MNDQNIMIVDDDLSLLRVIEHHLSGAGHQTRAINKPDEALKLLEEETFDMILCDMKMPGLSGLDILKQINKLGVDVLFIIITGYPTVEEAVEAMKLGAFDFIQKPVDKNHLLRVVEKASEVITLRRENRHLKSLVKQQFAFDKIIARSASMRNVCTQAAQVALSNVSILISGETGTGKELLAKAIHNSSKVKKGPFIALNCGAIPANLIEAELFGHVKGAFTGAVSARMGLFEAANSGTIFLDEIGDLPLEMQGKLLRVLQENVVVPVGSNTQREISVRVISATHQILPEMVSAGTFREDLFYRLNIVPLEIPPLRDRMDDIAFLFKHFIKKQLQVDGREMLSIDKKVVTVLEDYDWPGNVRELENLARRIVALTANNEIVLNDIPDNIQKNKRQGVLPVDMPDSGIDLEEWMDRLVVRALKKNDWNQSKTAKFLNISRNTLIYRMEKRGLRRNSD
ncbi:MAG: sigma-54-dependent Fis family transcriptional regulator [Fibrobacteria bacterium]|nr:sigma-54-dependent Fis family transcriptional regulator [Fibrobacteria bacterium]